MIKTTGNVQKLHEIAKERYEKVGVCFIEAFWKNHYTKFYY